MTWSPTRRTALTGAAVLAVGAATAGAAPADSEAPRQRFPVGRYGAVSDGRTDDSAAIERASAAASAVQGAVVFPVGTTVFNDLPRWHPDVLYVGAAPGAKVRITRGPNDGPKVVAPRVRFRDLTFTRGDDSSPFLRILAADCVVRDCVFTDTASPKSTALNIDAAGTDARIRNNTFRDVRSTSIFLDGCSGVEIEGNRITGQRWEVGYYAAIQMGNATRDTVIRRNVVRVDPDSAVPINGIGLAGIRNLVEHNVLRVSRFAVEAGPGVRGRIVRNFCTIAATPVTDGLNYAAGISLPKTTGMQVIGNTVDQRAATRSTWVGIELPESRDCLVRDNTLYGSRFGSQGIILDAANGCDVVDNTVVGYPEGITVYGHAGPASRNRITGNRIEFTDDAPTASGVKVLLDATGSADGNLISGNRITGAGSGRAISLDRQVGSGSLAGTRIGRNRTAEVDVPLHRDGDTGTVLP